MTPAEFKAARRSLKTKSGRLMTQEALARVMGYSGQPKIATIENRTTDVPAQAARLMEAYLRCDHRPKDWPK